MYTNDSRANQWHGTAFGVLQAVNTFEHHNKGNDDTSLRFVQEGNAATSAAKVALARATGVVISAGLGILGVTPVEEMR